VLEDFDSDGTEANFLCWWFGGWLLVIHAGRTALAPQPSPVVDGGRRRMMGAEAGIVTRAVLSSGRAGYICLSG
jgi:hypothetical protein